MSPPGWTERPSCSAIWRIHGPKISSPWPSHGPPAATGGRGRIGLHGQRGHQSSSSSSSRTPIERQPRRNTTGCGRPVGTSRTTTSCRGAAEEFYNAQVRRHLSASGIPVENSKGEWGRGQHEMNIRFTELLDMADRHTMMKQAMKEIADSTGVSITFMAKPDMSEAGSSCHLHVSLWAGETNAFPGDEVFGPVHGSDEFRWFLGGWMAHVPELMVFYADHQLLQALPRRFLGPDPSRLEL